MPEAAREDVDPAEWLAGGLCLARLPLDAAGIGEVLSSLLSCYRDRGGVPPAGLLADLCLLVKAQSGLENSRAWAPDQAELRSALNAYEDQLLARVVESRELSQARDALARCNPRERAHALGILVSEMLNRTDYLPRVVVDAGDLRRAAALKPDELLSRGRRVLRDRPVLAGQFAEEYRTLTQGFRRLARPLNDSDVFMLENIEVLDRLGQRVLAGQVIEAAAALVAGWPKRVRGRRKVGAVPAPLPEESCYPAGGFSSISNSGTLENLVSSELVYMERGKQEFDLFDVRYAEGELLYYTRDEGMMMRPRRHVVFAFDPSLAAQRVKDVELPWQRIVMALGLTLAMTERLHVWLGEHELCFSFVFLHPAGRPLSLGDELQVLELSTREWRERGTVQFGNATSSELAEQAAGSAARALTDVLWLGDETSYCDWRSACDDKRVRAQRVPDALTTISAWTEQGLELLKDVV